MPRQTYNPRMSERSDGNRRPDISPAAFMNAARVMATGEIDVEMDSGDLIETGAAMFEMERRMTDTRTILQKAIVEGVVISNLSRPQEEQLSLADQGIIVEAAFRLFGFMPSNSTTSKPLSDRGNA